MPLSSRSDVWIASWLPSADHDIRVGSPLSSNDAALTGAPTWTASARAAVVISMGSVPLDLGELRLELRGIGERSQPGFDRLRGQGRLREPDVRLGQREMRRQQFGIDGRGRAPRADRV